MAFESTNPIIFVPFVATDIRVDPTLPEKRLQLVDWFFYGDHDIIRFFFGPNITEGYQFLAGIVSAQGGGSTEGYFSRFVSGVGDGSSMYVPIQVSSELFTGMPGESMGVSPVIGNATGWFRYREV